MAQILTDTRLVCVGDHEADIVEMMRRARDLGHPADWLIRAKHNRNLPDGSKSWSQTMEEAPLGEIEFTMAARTAEAARVVRQQIWPRALNIPEGPAGQWTVTWVVAKAPNPPAGCKAVQWHLLTNRMASDFAEVVQ